MTKTCRWRLTPAPLPPSLARRFTVDGGRARMLHHCGRLRDTPHIHRREAGSTGVYHCRRTVSGTETNTESVVAGSGPTLYWVETGYYKCMATIWPFTFCRSNQKDQQCMAPIWPFTCKDQGIKHTFCRSKKILMLVANTSTGYIFSYKRLPLLYTD